MSIITSRVVPGGVPVTIPMRAAALPAWCSPKLRMLLLAFDEERINERRFAVLLHPDTWPVLQHHGGAR